MRGSQDAEAPTVSHAVVAAYVADAARSVSGVQDLHHSAWRSLSPRTRETRSGGVVVRESDSGLLDVDIHARVAWGSVIPDVAAKVERAVRQRVEALLDIQLGAVTLFVDEIAGPMEATPSEET